MTTPAKPGERDWQYVRSYGDVLASNVRAFRGRANLSQSDVAERMRALGFTHWLYQTVGNVERARRRVTSDEVLGLALALETTIPALMGAGEEYGEIELPAGVTLLAKSVTLLAGRGVNDHAVRWDGNAVTAVTLHDVPVWVP